jgi:chromosome partition protein MukF
MIVDRVPPRSPNEPRSRPFSGWARGFVVRGADKRCHARAGAVESLGPPPVPPAPDDPNQVLAALARSGITLELKTLDLCFLAALHLRANGSALSAFTEEQLADVFDQACAAVASNAEPERRATHAIRRLREQRMLARVDGAGVLRAGEFALTRLATGIVDFFLADETLTSESLTVLTRMLLASLTEVQRAATRAPSAADATEAWRAEIVAPLRVSVAELVGGIQRRQRGFDLQQEELQREIAGLLGTDWFSAVDRCQALLDATSATLRELNHVLLHDTHRLQSALQEIHELAAAAGADEADEAARAVMDQVDRIAAWGAARQRAWSDYYQYVHRFLRDVVRLDPARVLTHRLREALAGRGSRPFALTVAAAPPIRLLRAVTPPPGTRPPVRRKKKEEGAPLSEVAADDPQARLEESVRAARSAGARGLRAITEKLTAEVPREERFVLAGRIAGALAKVSAPSARAERPWLAVDAALQIEEWREEEASSG